MCSTQVSWMEPPPTTHYYLTWHTYPRSTIEWWWFAVGTLVFGLKRSAPPFLVGRFIRVTPTHGELKVAAESLDRLKTLLIRCRRTMFWENKLLSWPQQRHQNKAKATHELDIFVHPFYPWSRVAVLYMRFHFCVLFSAGEFQQRNLEANSFLV